MSSAYKKMKSAQAESATAHRDVCYNCMRPQVVCYCEHISQIPTNTRVLLLQHPRERDVGIGTARIAHMSLPNSELRVGVDFSDDPVVKEAIAQNAYLLFPGKDAMDLAEAQPEGPITLVVVDGTWWQAKSLWKRNPVLARLPQLRFTPVQKSNYRIRKEPADHCVATIEALAHVLGALEGDTARFDALLKPFVAMVDKQLEYAQSVQGGRARHRPRSLARGHRHTKLIAPLAENQERIVCVHGEVNAWPVGTAGSRQTEIVHWVMTRPHTGERFERVVAPRAEIGPRTVVHADLSRETLLQGMGWDAFVHDVRAFLRPNDCLYAWGLYPLDVIANNGAPLAHEAVDLRPVASAFLKRGAGAVHECVARMGLPVDAPWAQGRAGKRIAALDAVMRHLMQEAKKDAARASSAAALLTSGREG